MLQGKIRICTEHRQKNFRQSLGPSNRNLIQAVRWSPGFAEIQISEPTKGARWVPSGSRPLWRRNARPMDIHCHVATM